MQFSVYNTVFSLSLSRFFEYVDRLFHRRVNKIQVQYNVSEHVEISKCYVPIRG